ncbi:WD repeat-containing protein 91-like isoform X1 [Branchiostoma floridae]|uniref:WD repeat-containing protein 91 n=1 Tax=Branchiostoma floridae TaxID=7739 RepID=A0A9J7L268_BRAFL|nr:WD repeat-containing protein 91-like isoform X1 [Branchiostoma floridae]
MATSTDRMDNLVRDYLLFRGFTSTLKVFEGEIKSDKDRGFRADKVVDQMIGYIQQYELGALREYWGHLDRRVFCRLEHAHSTGVNKLSRSLLRLYLVHAMQNGRTEKVTEFFEKLAPEIQGQPEWREWFVLPFLSSPEQNPAFMMYFTKQWADTFIVSLHNFLSVIFHSMPVPTLLSFEMEQAKMVQLKEENDMLRQQVAVLQQRELKKALKEKEKVKLAGSGELMDEFYAGPMETRADPDSTKVARGKSSNSPSPVRKPTLLSTIKPQLASAKKPTGKTTAVMQKKEDNTQRPVSPGVQRKAQADVAKSAKPAAESAKTTLVQKQVMKQQKAVSLEQQRRELLSKAQAAQARSNALAQETQESTLMRKETEAPKDAQKLAGPSFTAKESKAGVKQEADGLSPRDGLSSLSVSTEKIPTKEIEEQHPFLVLSQEDYIEHHSSITHCRFSVSGTCIASADIDGVVKVWNFSPAPVTIATIMSKSPIQSLEWVTKPSRLLLLGSRQSTVRLYDTEAKKNLVESQTDPQYPRVVTMACSPSGSSFVCGMARQTGSIEGRLQMWDMKTMKVQRELPLDPPSVCANCTAFTFNGHLLVSGASDGVIRLYDMQRYDCLMSWQAHSGEVYSVQFSCDETSIFSMGADGKFLEWSVHRVGSKLADLPVHDGATGPFVVSGYGGYKQVQAPGGKLFAFDAEGNYVLTCTGNGGIIYKLGDSTLNKTLSLGGHRSPVVSVDWCTAMNCGTCVTGSMDGKIKVSTLLMQ